MSEKTRSLVEINIAVLLFGLAGLFGKLLALPPTVIVFGRVFFATPALALILLYQKQSFRLRSQRDYLWLSALGVILAIHWTTFFQSVQVSTVAIGLLSYSAFPIFVTFLEPYVFKEKIKFFDIAIAVITFFGLLLVIPQFDLSNNITQGVVWGLISGFTFAILSVLNKKFVQHYSGQLIAFYQDAVAMIVLLPFFLTQSSIIEPKDIALLALLGIVFTALSHTLFIKGMAHVKAQLASIIAALEPVYGVVFAVLLFGEIPSIRTILGGSIILGATLYASVKARHS